MLAGSAIHATRKSSGESGGLGIGEEGSELLTVGLDGHVAGVDGDVRAAAVRVDTEQIRNRHDAYPIDDVSGCDLQVAS